LLISSGELCGAILLDNGFLALLRDQIPPNTWHRIGGKALKRVLQSDWENGIKVQFSETSPDYEILLPVGSMKIRT
jgi:hypothetical protein